MKIIPPQKKSSLKPKDICVQMLHLSVPQTTVSLIYFDKETQFK